jgi:probable HAF family extracellular repeat protein
VVGWVEKRLVGGTGVYYQGMQGYVWDSVTGAYTPLGTLPGFGAGQATGINDAGQVVGTCGGFVTQPRSNSYLPSDAFLWQGGQMTDLHMPNVGGINNLGQVVGSHFLWQNGALTDLNTQLDASSGWVITSAKDINDAGQIVARATLDGLTHTVLLTPVDPGQAITLTVSGFPSPTTAGADGSFTVTVTDASGAPAAGYTGTVHFRSSDPRAVLPADYTFTDADGGGHTFSAALKTAGTQSITAADTATPAVAGSQTGIQVSSAAGSRLVVTGPSSVAAGAAFSITVRAADPYGNTATGYTGTVSFRSSDQSARLPANYTFTAADQGVHTFPGLVLKRRGAQTITATDTLNATITGTLNVNLVYRKSAARRESPGRVGAGRRVTSPE